MNSITKFRHFENFHIVLWLVKDLSSCILSRSLGVVMIAPTLLLAIYNTWIHRHEKSELLHNLAIVLWICATCVWMIGEFFYDDKTRSFAGFFFFAGLSTEAYYYI